MSGTEYPSQFFSPESAYLLDASTKTEQRYIEVARQRDQQVQESLQSEKQAASAIEAERRKAETLTEAELRRALLVTILSYCDALDKVVIASAAVERATDRMNQADTELRDYSDLDQKITDWYTNQVRYDRNDELAGGLEEGLRVRGMVIDRLDVAHKAYDKLQSEHAEALRHLSERQAHRSRAAAHIISRHMDSIAAGLNTALDHATELRRTLISAAAMWITAHNGTAPSPLPLSVTAREAIHRSLPDVQPDVITIDSLRDWHLALLNDMKPMKRITS